MFAPEGYVSFETVAVRIRGIAEMKAAQVPGLAPSPFRHLDLRDLMMKEYFVNCRSLSVASNSGLVLRISSQIGDFGSEPQLHETYSGYLFINPTTWTVSTKGFEERANAAETYVEGQMGVLRGKTFHDDGLKGQAWASAVSEAGWVASKLDLLPVFRQFEGWALVVKDCDVPNEGTEFASLRGDAADCRSSEDPSPSQIIAKIIDLFDQGICLPKPLAKELFAPTMGVDAWVETWKMAAKQRPELSKSGPRNVTPETLERIRNGN